MRERKERSLGNFKGNMMMMEKFVFLSINILFMFIYPILAQEVTTSSVTEITVTDSSYSTSSSSSAAAEMDSIYTTCDFDLENIENLLQYLPDICTEIYNNRTDDLYNLYLEESQQFAKFYKKLNDYELRDQAKGDSVEYSSYPFEKELRQDIYSKVDLALCITNSSNSVSDYLNCMTDKRVELTNLIPNVNKSI
ncbi:uncharacterized protein ACRADG_010725 isoform 2-T2 [Cochliomyia hominivorax]